MLKSLKKRSYRFVVVLLLLTTLLTFDVGRVTKVEAVATTAAIVGEVLLGLGVTYIAYQTLTGANVYLPNYESTDMYEYIRGLGRGFSQTRSGDKWYQRLYNQIINGYSEEVHLTRDELIELYNYNKDVDSIQSVSSYNFTNDLNVTPLNGYIYNFDIIYTPTVYQGGLSFADDIGTTITPYTGLRVIYYVNGTGGTIINSDLTSEYQWRNVLLDTGKYRISYSTDGLTWNYYGRATYGGYTYGGPYNIRTLLPSDDFTYYRSINGTQAIYRGESLDYPLLPDAPVYDSVNDEYMPLVPADVEGHQLTPQYPNNNDPEGKKYPIVPYVELPSNNGLWGFNWRDALIDIINRSGQLITASWLGNLINQFKDSLVGSNTYNDYSYYNEGDTYYIEYYNNAINYEYPTYNINISDEEYVIPVDLNTINKYTDNQYLTLIKERAETFGETFGEYVAFWHNCDPEIVYAFLGASIIVLLGAFIGKWGHS